MQIKHNKIIAIVGPTAVGKTKRAIDLALELDTEIISADSRQVYKEFDIATAKPSKEEQQGIKHHLINVLNPEEAYSVALFIDETRNIIKNLLAQNKTPIIVGGTGLYFKVLLENYNLPRVEANIELRKELENIANNEGNLALYSILQKLDERAAEKVHPNNVVRVIRFIELIKTLNKKLDEIVTKNDNLFYDVQWIGLNALDRSFLYERINKRVDLMLEKGLLEEAQYLYKKYGKIPSLQNTIGYQELIPFFDGEVSFDNAIEKLKRNSRRYAKRQLSLFNNSNFNINWEFIDNITL